MPNHIINNLTFHAEGKQLADIFESIAGKNGAIDFNSIIKTPDYIYQGALGPAEREKYGKNNWYDWNCDNWGTKWNAYDIYHEDLSSTITFFTAWSAPYPVIEALSRKYPDIQIELQYADESIGFNAGLLLMKGGEIETEDYYDDGSEEAICFSCQQWGDDPEYYI